MTFRASAFFLLFVLFSACGGGSRLSRYYTAEDKAVEEIMVQLEKNPGDKAAARLLRDAYEAAFMKRTQAVPGNVPGGTPGDAYLLQVREWEVVQQHFNKIKNSAVLSKAFPDPDNPETYLNRARQDAAEEFYRAGRTYLGYNTRQQAQQALSFFEKAASVSPGYKDVDQLMRVAAERAITRVLVNPVNYNQFSWQYWGFQNDWLQQQMVRDLNNRAFRSVRFYTEYELRSHQLVPDKIVDLHFVDLFIDRVHTENSRYERTRQIKTGQTKSIPPQPIYTTVKATVIVERRYMASYATLECRIYDRENNQNTLFDRFPDRFNWRQERARFTGDRRVLTNEDLALLINRWDDQPPTRQQIADRLIRNTYQLLLNRINNGVSF